MKQKERIFKEIDENIKKYKRIGIIMLLCFPVSIALMIFFAKTFPQIEESTILQLIFITCTTIALTVPFFTSFLFFYEANSYTVRKNILNDIFLAYPVNEEILLDKGIFILKKEFPFQLFNLIWTGEEKIAVKLSIEENAENLSVTFKLHGKENPTPIKFLINYNSSGDLQTWKENLGL